MFNLPFSLFLHVSGLPLSSCLPGLPSPLLPSISNILRLNFSTFSQSHHRSGFHWTPPKVLLFCHSLVILLYCLKTPQTWTLALSVFDLFSPVEHTDRTFDASVMKMWQNCVVTPDAGKNANLMTHVSIWCQASGRCESPLNYRGKPIHLHVLISSFVFYKHCREDVDVRRVLGHFVHLLKEKTSLLEQQHVCSIRRINTKAISVLLPHVIWPHYSLC